MMLVRFVLLASLLLLFAHISASNLAKESLDDLISVKSIGGRSKKRITQFMYPVELIQPVIGSSFVVQNLSGDSLHCFGNRDYNAPTFTDAFFCMFIIPTYIQIIPYGFQFYVPKSMRHWVSNKVSSIISPGFLSMFSMRVDCATLWGSRPIIVETSGSVELLKVHKLPPETISKGRLSSSDRLHIPVNATRWMHVSSYSGESAIREVRHIPAEPIYICARSDHWQGLNSSIKIFFRTAHIRDRDRQLSLRKLLIHIFLLSVVSLLPYLVAFMVAVFCFLHGINYIIRLLMFSSLVVCIAPFLATKKNRSLYRLYLNYFFTRHEESKAIIRLRAPLFQALFFSSAFICAGSAFSYAVYYYFGSLVDRELKNTMLKVTISIGVSWFAFFLCRSFERFCRDWAWIAMSVGLAQMLDHHLNPLCRENVIIATIILSQVVKFSVPKLLRISRVDALVKLCLPKLKSLLSSYGSSLHRRYHHYRYRHHHSGGGHLYQGTSPKPSAINLHKTLSNTSLKGAGNSSNSNLSIAAEGAPPLKRTNSRGLGMTMDAEVAGVKRHALASSDESEIIWDWELDEQPRTAAFDEADGLIQSELENEFQKDLGLLHEKEEGEARFKGFEDFEGGLADEEELEALFCDGSSESDFEKGPEDAEGDEDEEEEEEVEGDEEGNEDLQISNDEELKEEGDIGMRAANDFSFYSTASSHSTLRPSRRQRHPHIFYSRDKSKATSASHDSQDEQKAPLWKMLHKYERSQLSIASPSSDDCSPGSNEREDSTAARAADISELYSDKSTEFKNRMAFMRFEGINLSALISNEQIIRTIELYKKILRLPIESAKLVEPSDRREKPASQSGDASIAGSELNLSVIVDKNDLKAHSGDDNNVNTDSSPEQCRKGIGFASPSSANSPATPHKMSLTINVDNAYKHRGSKKVFDIDAIQDTNSPAQQKSFPYNQFNNIVGALTLPLSLVGPLNICFEMKVCRFQSQEAMLKNTWNSRLEDFVDEKEMSIETYSWLPLASLDKNMVDNLQYAANCLNDMLDIHKTKRSQPSLMVSKLYSPIRRKAVVFARLVFNTCDQAAEFHQLCASNSKSDFTQEKMARSAEDWPLICEREISIESFLEENAVQLELSLDTATTTYDLKDSLIYRYCDFPPSQFAKNENNGDVDSRGILLAGTHSLQHLQLQGKQLLLRHIDRIRSLSSFGKCRMELHFSENVDSNESLSPKMSRGRHPCSHYVSTTVPISSYTAAAFGFSSRESFLHASENTLLYDRPIMEKYISRNLCALFTAVNIDVSVVPRIVSSFQISHSIVPENETGDGYLNNSRKTNSDSKRKILDLCLFIPAIFGDREAMTSLSTSTAAPDTNTELCLDLLLANLYSDIGDQLLFSSQAVYDHGDIPPASVASASAPAPLSASSGEDGAKAAKGSCNVKTDTYLPDSDSIFGRTICGTILLAYLAYLQSHVGKNRVDHSTIAAYMSNEDE